MRLMSPLSILSLLLCSAFPSIASAQVVTHGSTHGSTQASANVAPIIRSKDVPSGWKISDGKSEVACSGGAKVRVRYTGRVRIDKNTKIMEVTGGSILEVDGMTGGHTRLSNPKRVAAKITVTGNNLKTKIDVRAEWTVTGTGHNITIQGTSAGQSFCNLTGSGTISLGGNLNGSQVNTSGSWGWRGM